jgi:hypothetical protein
MSVLRGSRLRASRSGAYVWSVSGRPILRRDNVTCANTSGGEFFRSYPGLDGAGHTCEPNQPPKRKDERVRIPSKLTPRPQPGLYPMRTRIE